MQEDNQNASDADVHSKQLDKASEACSLQPICEQHVPSIVSSGFNSNERVPRISHTELSSASNGIITNSSKKERQDYSRSKKQSEDDAELFNHQERLVTVDIFADCVSSCQ